MRIASIELDGRIEPGHRLPRALARISRKRGSAHIEVALLRPNHPQITHQVLAHDDEGLWSMADCLFETLEGHHGTNSDIHDLYRELQRFAD